MSLVLITVEGGCVSSILSDDDDIQVLLHDLDNEEGGDKQPVWYPVEFGAESKKAILEAADKADAWKE